MNTETIMINSNFKCFVRFYCSFPPLVLELHQQACTLCNQVVDTTSLYDSLSNIKSNPKRYSMIINLS